MHLYSTDKLGLNLWLNLSRDFRSVLGKNFAQEAEQRLMCGISEYRGYKYPALGDLPVFRWKAWHQLDSLLKKYRFDSDRFTDTELEELTTKSYVDSQIPISLPMNVTPATFEVLQQARKIAKGILGEFSPEALFTESKFGKKSSIGCPLSLAYIDKKLSDIRAFTGSSECSKWFFKDVLSGDNILKRITDRLPQKGCAGDLEHETLTLINVPKTWKTLRTITPLTLIGLFYSYGVGGQVTKKLTEAGLNISVLQNKHRKWVQVFSKTRTHATADLSRASDSITSELLSRVLPREWYVATKKCLTHQVIIDGKTYYSSSVLPMGNGLTFPMETLIFYSIIKALGQLTNIEGVFSVYGDDLIYPSSLHRYVRQIFPNLHFSLNKEKTFVEANFRESCGADYYRGCDVRPYFFKGQSRKLTKSQYVSEIYKTYNGLARRWSEHEIRGTLYYLLVELANLGVPLLRVPPAYPDTAGIKVASPELIPLDCLLLDWKPIQARFFNGSRWFRFSYLRERAKERFVEYTEPYYWLSLSGGTDEVETTHSKVWSYYDSTPEPPLRWKKFRRYRSYRKGKVTVRKCIVSFKPFVASKQATDTIRQTGTVSDWI